MRHQSLDDPLWRARVDRLLGPPQEIDIQDELKRRRQGKARVVKIVPNDAQCRHFWRLRNSNDNNNTSEQLTVTNKEKSGGTTKTHPSLEHDESECDVTMDKTSATPAVPQDNAQKPLESTQCTQTEDLDREPIAKKNDDAKTCRKRKRTSVSSDGGGWITRSTFYNKSTASVCKTTARSDSNDDWLVDEQSNLQNKEDCGISDSKHCPHRVVVASVNPDEQSNVPLRKLVPVSETNAMIRTKSSCVDDSVKDDDTLAESSSGKKEVSSERLKRQKRRLFRPTAARADKRMKQTSIKRMFGDVS